MCILLWFDNYNIHEILNIVFEYSCESQIVHMAVHENLNMVYWNIHENPNIVH